MIYLKFGNMMVRKFGDKRTKVSDYRISFGYRGT